MSGRRFRSVPFRDGPASARAPAAAARPGRSAVNISSVPVSKRAIVSSSSSSSPPAISRAAPAAAAAGAVATTPAPAPAPSVAAVRQPVPGGKWRRGMAGRRVIVDYLNQLVPDDSATVFLLEDQTRLARVLLTVADPLSHEPESAGLPPLMIGSFVEARISGKPIRDVVRIEREYVRQDDTIWLDDNGVLRIRELDIEFRDGQFAYVRSGLGAADQVITTNLATVFDGAALRLAGGAQ